MGKKVKILERTGIVEPYSQYIYSYCQYNIEKANKAKIFCTRDQLISSVSNCERSDGPHFPKLYIQLNHSVKLHHLLPSLLS